MLQIGGRAPGGEAASAAANHPGVVRERPVLSAARDLLALGVNGDQSAAGEWPDVINDYPRPFAQARLKWRVADASGHPGPEQARTLDIPAGSVIKVVELGTLPEVTTGKAHLTVWLEDASGQVLGRNHLDATDFVLRRASPPPQP